MYKVTEQYEISHATMRAEDLIPRFFEELEELQNKIQYTSDGDEPECIAFNTRITDLLAGIETRMEQPGYYETEQADWDIESLFDTLGEFAGNGLYFGSHPGDGSAYGFWQAEQDEQEQDEQEQDSPAEEQPARLVPGGAEQPAEQPARRIA